MSVEWRNEKRADPEAVRWRPMLGASLLFHAVLFALLLFVPDAGSIRKPPGDPVYQVELVDLPSSGGREPSRASEQPAVREPAEQKKAEASEPVTSTPKPARRIAEIKHEEKPVVIAKRTVEREVEPDKKTESSPSRLIDQAISRIERDVQARPEKKQEEPGTPKKTGESHLDRALADIQARAEKDNGGEGVPFGGGGLAGTAMQIYQARVHELIAGNWSYPVALETKGNPEATVLLVVKRDGTIISSRLIKRSSNEVFDQSVMRAIERSNPLPPFPEVYRKNHDEIQVRFSLEELGRS
jgi:colicin import membrane protein